MNNDKEMIDKRRFQKINNTIACKSYMKQGDVPENKDTFVYGFEHIETDKTDNHILVARKSDYFFKKR